MSKDLNGHSAEKRTETDVAFFRRVGAALVAAIALGAIVFALPFALIKVVGWPLWSSVPSISSIGEALQSTSITDSAVVSVLACLAWLLWALTVTSIVVEVIAFSRGTASIRLPLGGLVQPTVRRALLALLLVGVSSGALNTRPALADNTFSVSSPGARPTLSVSVEPNQIAPTSLAARLDASQLNNAPLVNAPPSAVAKSVTVAPRDTLWDLAERHLGDGMRWREIFELNRAVAQPDGGALTNPDLIRPGWNLSMPGDAIGTSISTGINNPPTAENPTSEAPPLMTPSTAVPPTTAPATTAVPQTTSPATTAVPQTTVPQTTVPDATVPETTVAAVTTPPTTVAQPSIPTDQDSPVTITSVAPPVANLTPGASLPEVPVTDPTDDASTTPTAADSTVAATTNNQASSIAPIGIGAAVSGALLAGVLFVMRSRRQRQRESRRIGQWPAAPVVAPVVEETVAARSAQAPLAWLEIAMRSLGLGISALPRAEWPLPHAVLATDDHVEVLLGTGSHFDAPAPWRAAKGGWSWILDRPVDLQPLQELVADTINPLPTLVTLGDSTNGVVYADLEAFGSVSLVGNAYDVTNCAAALMLDLRATNARDNDLVDIVAVDLADPGLAGLGRIRHVRSADEVVSELEARARAIGDSLAAVHRPNTFAGRAGAFGEDFGFAPLVMFVNSNSISARTAERVCELADGGGLGLAVVFVGEHVAPTWLFDVEDDELRVASLNLTVTRSVASADDIKVLEGLLGSTPAPLVSTPVRIVEEITASADEIDLREEVEGHEIEVRVVGQVDAVSVNGVIAFTKAMELVTFLLFHREIMSLERIFTALFPGEAVDTARVDALIDDANALLGRPSSGGSYVIRQSGGVRVSPLVGTDLDVLLHLADNANHQSPTDAILTLSNALDVVRGVPFDGLRHGQIRNGFAWAHAEGLVDKIDAVIVDVAHRLAELCLDADDAPGALWAVNQGLLASPLNELLYCDRMLAHYAAGDRNGVIATMHDLERAVAGGHNGAPVTQETRALYSLLLRDTASTLA